MAHVHDTLLRHKVHETEAHYTHYNNIWMWVITGDAAYWQGEREDPPPQPARILHKNKDNTYLLTYSMEQSPSWEANQ